VTDRDLTLTSLQVPRFSVAMAAMQFASKPKPVGVIGRVIRRIVLGNPMGRR